eukprot:5850052-Karenia_brevis.AAC.1
MGNYPVIFRSTQDNAVHMDPVVEREIQILLKETRDDTPENVYEMAYDTLAHDLLRDDKLRKRGVA